jgi:hypothetical protein
MKKILVSTALVGSVIAVNAQAEIIQVTVEGRVNESDVAGFDIEQVFTSVFEYESAGGPDSFFGNNLYFFENRISSVSFASGSWSTSDTGLFGLATIIDNLEGDAFPLSDAIAFQVANDASLYPSITVATTDLDGIGDAEFLDANIGFGSSTTDDWDGSSLPGSYDASTFNFESGQLAALLNFSSGAVHVEFDSFEWAVVPSPGALVVVGVGCIAGTRRRRAA